MRSNPAPDKSTVKEICARFDADVERFSNLDTGQSATIDAPLVLDLIASAASTVTPSATHLLDIGCGAGNYTLKLLERLPKLDVTLIDLSLPMLTRARERISAKATGAIRILQQDVRDAELGTEQFDIVTAAAVLHHLRTDEEWHAVFAKLYACLRPGGSLWIADLVEHSLSAVQTLMWNRYGEYLTKLRSEEYRDQVYAYVEREDTPRPLLFQLDLLREVGFTKLELLHKNSVFAAVK